jgi:hypothetical protein
LHTGNPANQALPGAILVNGGATCVTQAAENPVL